ncbi:MAG: hypothetical protein AAYR33_08075 [Acetobacteraceae bacterium]
MEDEDLFATHMRRALLTDFPEDADHVLRDRAIIISSSYRKAVHLAQLSQQHLCERLICIFLTKMSIAASPLLEGAHAVECASCFERKFFAHLSSLEDHLWTQDSAALSGKFYASFLPSHLTMFSAILRRAVRDEDASRKNSLLYHFFDGSVRRLAFSPLHRCACRAPSACAPSQDFSQFL